MAVREPPPVLAKHLDKAAMGRGSGGGGESALVEEGGRGEEVLGAVVRLSLKAAGGNAATSAVPPAVIQPNHSSEELGDFLSSLRSEDGTTTSGRGFAF